MSAAVPPIPLEDVATYPLPGWAFPSSLAFSPDDQLVTFLHSADGSLVRQLYQLDLETGEQKLLVKLPGEGVSEENLTLEEKLRRERQRVLELGVTQYAWAKKGERLLLPLPDGTYVLDDPDSELRKLVDCSESPAIDPQLSPDGEWLAYVQDHELRLVPAAGGDVRQLTFGAQPEGLTHGLAEYIAQEEMGRKHGFWWSPDSRQLAFTEVDERHIPVYRIMHQGKGRVGAGAQEDHRYPFAGQANAVVRLGVISLDGDKPTWMDLGDNPDIYLARVDWLPDGSLAAQIENREQTILDLVRFDPSTGCGQRLLREINNIWINLHDLFRPLKTGKYAGGFIWASERSGYRHLYLYTGEGQIIRQLTSGEWMVDELAGVDEANGQLYFTGTLESPIESHLYAISLEGGKIRRLTREPGMHSVTIDHGCHRFIDVHNSLEKQPNVILRSLADGELIQAIYNREDPRAILLKLHPPELVKIENRKHDMLFGAVYRPPDRFGPGPYPTIVLVYGGPHAQMVTNGWRRTSDLSSQSLSRLGFLVFVLDNRGSARRGLAFEGAIKHNLGDQEVQDQEDGVRWLVAQGLADPERVGIIGWSYGGYMAAMCLGRAAGTFQVAVAGAPVSAWDGYDTHYTERYMSSPQSNPQGYTQSSVLSHVEQMRGKLLLVHGLIDENVHFRHTARLINALIEARKAYDLLLFPDERHTPRRLQDRVYQHEQIHDFFVRHLANASLSD